MTIYLHQNDLPEGLTFPNGIAIDTETMGLATARDRLCLVQLSGGDGHAHLVQIAQNQREAPRLKALLTDPSVIKIFHFARFDLAALKAYLDIECVPVYCTRTASKLVRTYSDKHGLREITKELLGIEMNKQQQSSDWGAETLTAEQQTYAASDVLHLHALKSKLDVMLAREGRAALAQACFDFLPVRAMLDLHGWAEEDIFAH